MFTFEFTSKESGYKQNSVAYEKVVFASRLEKQAGAFFGPGCTQNAGINLRLQIAGAIWRDTIQKGVFQGSIPCPATTQVLGKLNRKDGRQLLMGIGNTGLNPTRNGTIYVGAVPTFPTDFFTSTSRPVMFRSPCRHRAFFTN